MDTENLESELERNQESKRKLTVADFVPCGTYNLLTLVNFKLLDLLTAVRLSGQEVSTFDDNEKYQALAKSMMGDDPTSEKYRTGGLALAALIRAYEEHSQDYRLGDYSIDSDLAGRLTQSGIQVPKNKKVVFGNAFSKIAAYNSALTKPILTDADGASPEFRAALYHWDEHLDPFSSQLRITSKERFARAKPGEGLEIVWGLAVYMRESLAAGTSQKKVRKVIDEKLGELLSWDSYFGTTPDTPLGREIQRELRVIRASPELVFENYRRVDQFRDQFRDQIRALVDLYSGSQWSEKTQAYAHRIEQFLGRGKDTSPSAQGKESHPVF